MPMEDRFYTDYVTYWGILSRDEFSKITYTAPVTFKGWWEDKIVDMLGAHGETFVSRSTIHLPDTLNATLDGWLFRGISMATDPTTVDGAYRILDIQSIPDLRAVTNVKVAVL